MPAGTSLPALLDGHRYAALTTFRRDGRPVTTTVWFAVAGDAAYFRTGAGTGKAKRLRRNPRVRIAPANARGRPLGPDMEATVRPLSPDESETARRSLERRYGLQVRLVDLILRVRRQEPVFFRIDAV